jgi:ABC-type antimicrobial peptide transport system permease subunit
MLCCASPRGYGGVAQLAAGRFARPWQYRRYCLAARHRLALNTLPRRSGPEFPPELRDGCARRPTVRARSHEVIRPVARPRFAQLLGVFATVALLLSAIGTYGVLAFAVMERRREIGIRMALGATENGVLAMVLRQGLTLAAAGLVIGLLGAAALTRLTTTLLFGVTPLDPPTFVAVGAFMLLVAGAAAIIPARRATRVDPLTALRSD